MKASRTIDLITNDSPENTIHIAETLKAIKFISEQLPAADSYDPKNNDNRPINYKTILINGGRGTGKTTFLYNLLENIKQESFAEEFEVLPFLDPTMIEEKASIFLTVVSLIKSRMDKYFSENNYAEETFCKKRCWEQLLEKFAEGIPITNENPDKAPDFWDDANQIMSKGLKDVNASFQLRKNFAVFVYESLNLLEKNAFFLIIDDVDTDYKKSWKLLEIIRKYLSIPQLIIVVSGDIRLFDSAVQYQYKDLKEEKSDLANQYLKKVLPSRYRINLKSLKELNEDKPYGKIIVNYSKKDAIDLLEYLRDMGIRLGIMNPSQFSPFKDFILSLPLRTNIELMRLFKDNIRNNKVPIDIDTEDIVNLFLDELRENEIDTEQIKSNPAYINSLILKFLLKSGKLLDFYQLQPIATDITFNSCLFALNLINCIDIHYNPELVFDYMIKIGFVRNIRTIFDKVEEKESVNFYFTLEGLVDFTTIYSTKDLRQMMCGMLAYLRSYFVNKEIDSKKFGFIYIKDKDTISKLDSLRKNFSGCLSLIPCSRSVSGTNTYYEYSIYTYIAAIYDIVLEFHTGNSLSKIIQRLSQIKDYNMVGNKNNDKQGGTNYTGEQITEENIYSFSNIFDFSEDIRNWIEYCSRLIPTIPVHVLAKVSTRFFFAMSNMKATNLADYMQLAICNLFNSALIEEVSEYSSRNDSFFDITLDNHNLIDSPQIFLKNFEKCCTYSSNGDIILNNDDYMPLSKIFLTCPFLMIFMNPDSSDSPWEILSAWYKTKPSTNGFQRWPNKDFKESLYCDENGYKELQEFLICDSILDVTNENN